MNMGGKLGDEARRDYQDEYGRQGRGENRLGTIAQVARPLGGVTTMT